MHRYEKLIVQAVEISSLAQNPNHYKDKRVRVKGNGVKVNEGIRGRNRLHLADPHDPVKKVIVTTQSGATVGKPIYFEAVVRLNRDFGAGYS